MSLIFSDPDGTRPVNIALKSVLLPWLIAIGMRGMRAATGPGDSEGAVRWSQGYAYPVKGSLGGSHPPGEDPVLPEKRRQEKHLAHLVGFYAS